MKTVVHLLWKLQAQLLHYLWGYVPVRTLVITYEGVEVSWKLRWLKNTKYLDNPNADETWAHMDEKCFVGTNRGCLMFKPVLGVFILPVLVYRGDSAVPFEFGILGEGVD